MKRTYVEPVAVADPGLALPFASDFPDFTKSAGEPKFRVHLSPSGPLGYVRFERPSQSVFVPDVSGCGGPAHCQDAGVPLHTQARRLAEYGGDRVKRILPQLPQSASPRCGIPLPGSPDPGTGTEPCASPLQLALRHPGRQGKALSSLPHHFLT